MNKEIIQQKQIAKEQINLANALKRLYANTDFVLLIQKHYSTQLVEDLVNELAKHNQDSDTYKSIINNLNAISHFRLFLDKVLDNEAMAHISLKEIANLETGDNDE